MDELEDPFIALGIVENRDQVCKMIDEVDEDGSGQIEFKEFLEIIRGDSQNTGMNKIFKKLMNGNLL